MKLSIWMLDGSFISRGSVPSFPSAPWTLHSAPCCVGPGRSLPHWIWIASPTSTCQSTPAHQCRLSSLSPTTLFARRLSGSQASRTQTPYLTVISRWKVQIAYEPSPLPPLSLRASVSSWLKIHSIWLKLPVAWQLSEWYSSSGSISCVRRLSVCRLRSFAPSFNQRVWKDGGWSCSSRIGCISSAVRMGSKFLPHRAWSYLDGDRGCDWPF